MSQYPPNPNNPYGQNPSDPNYNQGTAYGGGPPSGPDQGSNPYNPYPGSPPAPGTNPNPYGPYGTNPPTPAPPPNTGYPPNDPYGQTVASTNPNFNQYASAPPAPPLQPPTAPVPPRKGPSIRVILIAAIALVLIIGGIVIALVSYTTTQQGYTNATATARANATATFNAQVTATAHANATASAIANATATAIANANATATALVTSQYPPFTNLAFNDPLNSNHTAGWNEGTECQFTSTGYQVSIAQSGFFWHCIDTATNFSDFAYQVTMTITQGDCGGLIFRAADDNDFYTFDVCQTGLYDLALYSKSGNTSTKATSSSAIHTGLNQVNTLAVVVQGNTFNLYANGQHINSFTDSTFAHGEIGLLANDTSNPTVVNYTNALVWRAS